MADLKSTVGSPLKEIPKICKYYQGLENYGKPIKKLGEGTYGRVELYNGGDYGLPVAVKTSLLAEPWMGIFSSCVRESSILIHLHHPNIVRILDAKILKESSKKLPEAEKKNKRYVEVLELIMDNRGEQLANFTDLLELQIKRYIFQLLSALAYLHSQGIYHRDIKPQNILIEGDHLTLVDFGISRQSTSGTLEYTGEMFTLAYRPPEVLMNEKYDESADIWTVGTVWLYLLMGKTPFLNGSDNLSNKMIYKNIKKILGLKKKKDYLHLLRGKINKTGYTLLNQLLAIKPEHRISPIQALENPYFDNVRSIKREKISPGFGYTWQENSCYLDSLLMILFASKTNFWLEYILDFDPQSVKYGLICQKSSIIQSQEQLEMVATEIQKFVRNSYLKLGKEEQTCQSLRLILQQCYPDLKENNKWVYYNVASVYNLFTDLFPALKIPYSQILYKHDNNFKAEQPSNFNTASFTVHQFVEEINKQDKQDIIEIEWKKINHPVLVFENTGARMNKRDLDKFRFKILDKYQLIGVIVFLVKLNHNVCYFLDNDGWKYYDGLKKKIENIDFKLEFNDNEIPLMFFYRNIENSPINIDYQLKLLTPKEALDSRSQLIKNHSNIVFEKRTLQTELLFLDCVELGLYYKTFFLAVKLMDIFININASLFGRGPRTVGLACLSLAIKFYETRIFTLERLVNLSDNLTNEDKIFRMERNVFVHLCFNVNYSTSIDYYVLHQGDDEYLYRLACLIRSPYYSLSDEELAKKAIKFDNKTEDVYEEYFRDDLDESDLLI
jgi:serine/threonine protein kinase